MRSPPAAAALALVALAAACGGQDEPLVIDEQAATVAGVGVGSRADEVTAVFGEPGGNEGFFPLEDDVRGPYSFPIPGGGAPEILRFDHAAFALTNGRVFAFIVSDEHAETVRGVGVGDDLDDAREAYSGLECREAYAGESLLGGSRTYTLCRAELGGGRILVIEEDPIRSISLLDLTPP